MELVRLCKNIITLGADWRLESWVAEFDTVTPRLDKAFNEMEGKRQKVNQAVESLVNAKRRAVKSLKRLRTISRNVKAREREVSERSVESMRIDVPLTKVEDTISQVEIARHGAKGAGIGISTALGTWALIGTFGTASTGTAISTLAGAAATNATLAWLGGGSLAAGSLGMAGGTVVLGGIIVIPAVVIMGVFSHISIHKKVKQIKEAIAKAELAIASYNEVSLKLGAMEQRAREVIMAVDKARATFDIQLRSVYEELFPFRVVSRIFRNVRQFFGGKYFTEEEVALISPLLQMASSLAEIVDIRILDESANLVC